MSRGVTLTAAQLSKLMKQTPQNLERVLRPAAALAPPKESEIETAIVRAMVLDGWRPFKMQYSFDKIKKLTLGELGMSDHLFIRYWNQGDPRGPVPGHKTRCYNPTGEILWWEFKRIRHRKGRKPKATDPEPEQVKWTAAERARGALVWVAGVDHEASIAGAAKHYLESGICRRREIFEALL